MGHMNSNSVMSLGSSSARTARAQDDLILLDDIDQALVLVRSRHDEDHQEEAYTDDPLPEEQIYQNVPKHQLPTTSTVTPTAWEKVRRIHKDDPARVLKASQYFAIEKLHNDFPRFTLQECSKFAFSLLPSS